MTNTQVSTHHDIREFISRKTWTRLGPAAIEFVQARIINVVELLQSKIALDLNIPVNTVSIYANTWHLDPINGVTDAGYRSAHDYYEAVIAGNTEVIDEQFDSFHRQGHAVNVTCEVIMNNKRKELTAYEIASVILNHEDSFILNGLSVIGEPRKSRKGLHLDCRNTRSFKLKILG